jgi:hypothetical protein
MRGWCVRAFARASHRLSAPARQAASGRVSSAAGAASAARALVISSSQGAGTPCRRSLRGQTASLSSPAEHDENPGLPGPVQVRGARDRGGPWADLPPCRRRGSRVRRRRFEVREALPQCGADSGRRGPPVVRPRCSTSASAGPSSSAGDTQLKAESSGRSVPYKPVAIPYCQLIRQLIRTPADGGTRFRQRTRRTPRK